MKNLFTFLLLVISVPCIAQKSLLDERNGFKSIELGTPKSSFSNLTLEQDWGSIKLYKYKPLDPDLYKVFDDWFDEIVLHFDKSDKLVSIWLVKVFKGTYFNDLSINLMNKTHDKFIILFGKAHELVKEETKDYSKMGLKWYGDHMSIEVSSLYYGVIASRAETHVIFEKASNLSSGF